MIMKNRQFDSRVLCYWGIVHSFIDLWAWDQIRTCWKGGRSVHGPVGYDQESFTLMWRWYQLLSGSIPNGRLSWVSRRLFWKLFKLSTYFQLGQISICILPCVFFPSSSGYSLKCHPMGLGLMILCLTREAGFLIHKLVVMHLTVLAAPNARLCKATSQCRMTPRPTSSVNMAPASTSSHRWGLQRPRRSGQFFSFPLFTYRYRN